MNRCQVLFASTFVVVKRFDHPADVPHEDAEETGSDTYSVNFLERGAFSVSWDGGTALAGVDTILRTRPGSAYRCRHRDRHPNDIILGIALRDAWSEALPGTSPETGVPRVVVPVNYHQAYLRQRLRSNLRNAPALTVESIAAELLTSVWAPGTGSSGHKFRTRMRHVRQVATVSQLLDEHYALRHSLTELAAVAGMSPFHFARIFQRVIGVPPHRYLILRRLDAATEYLAAGMSVTETCFAVGFENVSHFIRSFHRAYGLTPSRFTQVGSPRVSPTSIRRE